MQESLKIKRYIKFMAMLTAILLAAMVILPLKALAAEPMSRIPASDVTVSTQIQTTASAAAHGESYNKIVFASDIRLRAIAELDLLCTAIILLVLIHINMYADTTNKTAHWFVNICLAAIVRFVGNIFSYLTDGRKGLYFELANQIFSFVMLISTLLMLAAFSVFMYYYVGERKRQKKTLPIAGISISAVVIILVLISRFNGMIYYIDGANVYRRGEYYIIYYVLISLLLLYMTGWSIQNRHLLSKKEIAAFMLVTIMPLVGMLLQYTTPTLNPADAFITVGICAAFLNLQSTILNHERQGKLSYASELAGISQIFTGVYRWNQRLEQMESSDVSPEYTYLLDDKWMNIKRFLDTCVNPNFRNSVSEFISTEHIEEINAMEEKAIREIEYKEIGPHEGEWRRLTLIHLPAPEGQEPQLYMVFQDITYEKQLLERSAAQSRRFIATAAGVYTDICEWNMKDDTALRLSFTPEGIEEKPLEGKWSEHIKNFVKNDIMPEDVRLFQKAMPQNLMKAPPGTSVCCSFRVKADGEYRWNAVTAKVFKDGHGNRLTLYMQQDIEDSVREHNCLKDRSEHDCMTDLFNRAKLEDMKNNEYKKLSSCGVLFFDLDGLKQVNDTLGHGAGDKLIMTAAESVRSITNRRILAYRIGGDEMLVIAGNASQAELEQLIELWRVRLDALNQTAEIPCSMSLGYAWAAGDFTVDELIHTADSRMYKNKQLGAIPRR